MNERRISLAHVEVTEQARENILDCLDTGMLARGKYIWQFEEAIAEFAGTKHAVAVCNGTVADTIVLRATMELWEYRSVITPILTFAAQLSAVRDAGLMPFFVDVGRDLAMQVSESPADAICPYFAVSLLGVPSWHKGRYVILDSCETFVRGFGRGVAVATCSFYATHAVGIGEGGAIVTDSDEIADVCRSLRDHGQQRGDALSKFRHERCGYNGKMSNLAAAVGCGQIAEADEINAARLKVASWYDDRLGGSWASRMASPHGYPIETESKIQRDLLLLALTGAGIECRRVFSMLPIDEPGFAKVLMHSRERSLWPGAQQIADRWLYLPCHQGASRDDVGYICGLLKTLKLDLGVT